MATQTERPRTVEAEINYIGPMDSLPFFYARDHERDNLVLEPHRYAPHAVRHASRPCVLGGRQLEQRALAAQGPPRLGRQLDLPRTVELGGHAERHLQRAVPRD